MTKQVLIVVDMQNDFIDGALGSPMAQAMLPNLVTKLENLDPETFVIFTKDTHGEDYLDTHEGKLLPVPHCIKDSHGWEIPDCLTKEFAGAPVVVNKPTFGSFDLMQTISEIAEVNENDSFNLEFCGLCTDICVVSNAIIARAYFPNADISVDAKCCAGVTPQSHISALETMKSCQIAVNE